MTVLPAPIHPAALKPRLVEVVEIINVGFEVYTEGPERRRPRYFSIFAEEANAEARSLHDLDVAFHELGKANGAIVDRPAPILRLWEGGDAKP